MSLSVLSDVFGAVDKTSSSFSAYGRQFHHHHHQ